MRDLMRESGQAMIDPIQASIASSDLLISSFSALPIVQTASEKSGVPFVNAQLQPQNPTRSGAAALAPVVAKGSSILNRWTGDLAQRAVWWVAKETTNTYRAGLGLRPHNARSYTRAINSAPAVMGFSSHVVPKPADWPAEAVLTGFWFLDEETGPPAEHLAQFLGAGAPPVYLGFGSMSSGDPMRTMDLILAAVKQAGVRAVVAAGWGDLRSDRMSDQPYWGRRIHELGVGVAPIERHKLTAERLAARLIGLVNDPRIRERAAALGEGIRAEHGVETAVTAIEKHYSDVVKRLAR
jgi:sterol 3beta-glucosyltransferase